MPSRAVGHKRGASNPGALILAGLVLLSVLAFVRSSPPSPKSESAPANEFSAMRAHAVLADLVGDGAPHPAGTPAHERVRDKITAKLKGLGFDVEWMTGFECGPRICASVTNLLARLPGKVGAKAVLLTAHYDSVPAGPGASDDGMGVATLLEAARALKVSPTLRRPVWILVTDGEELGLLGAKAFAKNNAYLDEVGVVVNVEARGTTGPSLMFETSANNAGLVKIFAASTGHPVASSIFPAVYKLLPNGTDLMVYKAAGLAGLNYAVIGGALRYHTPRDDLNHADIGSLQHHGDNALAVVRALADGRDSTVATSDLVFFDVLGAFVARWPDPAGPWIVLALIVGYAGSTVLAFRSGLMTPRELLVGLSGWLSVAAAAAVAWVCGAGLRLLGAAPAAWPGGAGPSPMTWVAHPTPWIVASCGLGGVAAAAVAVWVATKAGVPGLFWGATAVLIAMGAVAALLLPGFSFLFLVPAVGGAVGSLGWALAANGPAHRGGAMLLWTAPMAVLAVIVGAAPLGLVYDALGTSFLPAVAAGTGMIVWAASPSIASLTRRTRARLMSAVATASLVAAAVALVVAPFTVDAPAHDSLRTYVAEGEEAKTTLATFDRPPAALAALFPKRDVPWPWASEHAPTAPAGPMAPEPSPTLELLSSEALRGVGGSSRRVVVKLRSSRGASIVGLAVHAQVSSSGVVVHGEPLGPERANRGSEPWRSFECVTTPPEGLEVDLTLDASGPVEAYVYDRTPGLPEGQPQKLRNARPPTAVPVHFGDVTVVARRVEL